MYEDTVCTATHKMVINGCLGVGRGEAKKYTYKTNSSSWSRGIPVSGNKAKSALYACFTFEYKRTM